LILLSLGAAVCAAPDNARWQFLVANLQVFPGTEKLFEPDDRLFWRLATNLKNIPCAERQPDREFRFMVSTDSNGYRKQPRAAGPKILFLGDSCTFGIPVNDDETFPALVQHQLPGMQTVNAGVPGYTAYQGRLLLESLPEAPAVVVITFWPNDRSSWDHLSDAEHAEWIAAERSGNFSRLRVLRMLRKAMPGGRPRLTGEEFAAEIRRMIGWCRARNSTPVVHVWPTRQGEDVDRQEILRRIASEERVLLVDEVPLFRAHGRHALFADAVHATREGYALAARSVVEALRGHPDVRLLDQPGRALVCGTH
jgi:lysophospholipase L1-like esterase